MNPVLRLALLLWPACLFAGDARQDWDAVKALDRGPGVEPKSAAEALSLSLSHIERQENALRAFLNAHPDDANAFEAMLRLVRALDLRAELKSAEPAAEAVELIGKARDLATTDDRRVEFDFALLARRMRRWRSQRPPLAERRDILDEARKFQVAHPGDRRIAWLLAEVAALFDFDPPVKEGLLAQAKKAAKDPALAAQIADDQRRLGFLGRPLPLRFTALDGRRVDVTAWRGKVVGVVFFATWSAPSVAALKQVHDAVVEAGPRAELVAISLDSARAPLDAFIRDNALPFPIAWDGKGWDGPLIQALGINAVPTAWLLDPKGVLRSLDALEDTSAQMRRLLGGK